jgi:TatA/E family protein of Tat protein translocase
MMLLSATPGTLAFLGGSTGTGEILVLFLVVLILFGPRRLPEMARMVGRAMQDLRRAAQDFRDQVMRIDPGLGREAPPKSKPSVTPLTHPRQPAALPPADAASLPVKDAEPMARPPSRDGSAGG